MLTSSSIPCEWESLAQRSHSMDNIHSDEWNISTYAENKSPHIICCDVIWKIQCKLKTVTFAQIHSLHTHIHMCARALWHWHAYTLFSVACTTAAAAPSIFLPYSQFLCLPFLNFSLSLPFRLSLCVFLHVCTMRCTFSCHTLLWSTFHFNVITFNYITFR